MAETPQNPLKADQSITDRPHTTPRTRQFTRWPWLAGGLAALVVVALFMAHVFTPTPATRTNTPRTASMSDGGASVPATIEHGGGPGCTSAAQQPSVAQAISLSDLSMVSANEGWAVGGVVHFGGNVTAGVILHYSNGQWQQIAGNFTNLSFDSIAMTSPTDGWIGGIDTSTGSLGDSEAHATRVLYHFDGHTWQAVALPTDLFANTNGGTAGATIVRMYSATDGWLMVRDATTVGNYTLLHYDGTHWQPVQTPFASSQNNFFDFAAMTTTSANDVWLAGAHTDDSGNGGQSAVIAHYHAGQWSTIANAPVGSVESITMTSATSGWAIDNYRLIAITGQQAVPVTLPDGLLGAKDDLMSVAVAPDGSPWIAGGNGGGGLDPAQVTAFVLNRHSDGTWERIAFPYQQQLGVMDALASDDFWAIGSIPHFRGCAPAAVTFIDQGTILHYHAGQWSQVVEPTS